MYSYESDEEEGHVVYANPDSFFASNGKAEKGPEHVDTQKFSSFSASLARFKALGNQVYKYFYLFASKMLKKIYREMILIQLKNWPQMVFSTKKNHFQWAVIMFNETPVDLG